jgi:hypothetical protein
MAFTKETAAESARRDLAKRLGVDAGGIREVSAQEADFPDMSLGAPVGGEMSAQMISSGWRIMLGSDGKDYEYRADKHQLRLHNFKGRNYVIKA